MNVLLIGNGFDLAHGLPTTYRDFLNFCDSVVTISETTDYAFALLLLQGICEKWNPPSSIRTQLQGALFCRDNIHHSDLQNSAALNTVNDVYSHIHDNLWFHYFKKRLSFLGYNWIDFEKEISYVIQMLETVQITLDEHSDLRRLSKKDKVALEAISEDFGKNCYSLCGDKETLVSTRNTLSNDLDRLTHALELYLSAFVNAINIPEADICTDIPHNPDKVLSFNYTNTHERILNLHSNAEYCYIHGKASNTNTTESCNMVLGIDEYLDDDRKNSDLEFLHFKKFYQRLYKSTDSTYLTWFDTIKIEYSDYIEESKYALSNNTTVAGISIPRHLLKPRLKMHTLYIFGHSLDVTDGDVLRQFICNDNVQTKIYYHRKHEHDKSVLGQLIHNLVRIIGQDELIRRTGGSHKTIEFIPQTLRE